MVVGGASRHALEIYDIFISQNKSDLIFYDDVNQLDTLCFANKYPIICSLDDLSKVFSKNKQFVLGLGGTTNRFLVAQKFRSIGGELTSIISNNALIGTYDVHLGQGINIMNYVMISSSVTIGEGSLINAFASIHHNVKIGNYTEISPSATLLGGAVVGNFCSVGAGAIILPNIEIGNNVIIGAGAVVTKDIQSNTTAVGIPAKIIKNK
jgi:sugar O-acyltransferase (sialic acid O-acetyltransferase NeuD family)